MNIEPLESRIAPATLAGNVLSYTDLDGDAVTVKTTVGTFVLTNPNGGGTDSFTLSVPNGAGGQVLQLIDLHTGGFDTANLTVSVTKKPGGDGFANVGYINSTGHDLGAVVVKGDLAVINAGDNTTATGFGVKSLDVQSLGAFGTSTGGPVNGDGTLESHIIGALGTLKVKGNLVNAWLHVTGNGLGDEARGTVGAVTLGGSIIGGDDLRGGAIESSGDMGVVKIGRDIAGGTGDAAGFLQSDTGTIASVTLGGSLLGGSAIYTGGIRSGGGLGPVKITDDVRGGGGAFSGIIASDTGFGVDDGDIASVTVGGSVFGGDGANSGVIRSSADLGPVKIGQDVRGGIGDDAGKIISTGDFKSLSVGGSILGDRGDFNTDPMPARWGQIVSVGTMGAVTVKGSLHGGIDDNGPGVVGGGSAGASIFSQGNMGAVNIGGDVHGTVFRSGHIESVNGHIASVTIAGSIFGGPDLDLNDGLTGASLSGMVRALGDIGFVKIGHDLVGNSATDSGRVSASGSIGSVTVGGSILGGVGRGSGGITASGLGTVKVGGNLVGASISGTITDRFDAGSIQSFLSIGSIFIGGSIVTGVDTSTGGNLTNSGAIIAQDSIGSLTVRGSIIGHPDTGTGATIALISARGQNALSPKLTASSDVAIGKISIGGSVVFTQILAGYTPFQSPAFINADAQVGAVKVGGDWIASSLIAGVENYGANMTKGSPPDADDNLNFGDGNDHKIGGPSTKDTSDLTLMSRIASITVKGFVTGTSGGTDRFGFAAQQIGSFKAAGFTATLTSGTDAIIPLSLNTGDVAIHEV